MAMLTNSHIIYGSNKGTVSNGGEADKIEILEKAIKALQNRSPLTTYYLTNSSEFTETATKIILKIEKSEKWFKSAIFLSCRLVFIDGIFQDDIFFTESTTIDEKGEATTLLTVVKEILPVNFTVQPVQISIVSTYFGH